jgi:ferredoxin
MAGKARQIKNPDCLGQMNQRYCGYCSEGCPVTALCVLVSMGEYLLNNHKPSQESESTNYARPLAIPPLIVPPDES